MMLALIIAIINFFLFFTTSKAIKSNLIKSYFHWLLDWLLKTKTQETFIFTRLNHVEARFMSACRSNLDTIVDRPRFVAVIKKCFSQIDK